MIDTHAHVVADDKTRYPLRPFDAEAVDESLKQAAVWHQAAQISAPDLLGTMDAAGVDAALLVQALSAYGYDNRYAVDSAAEEPRRFASVCIVDPDDADPAERLRYWVQERGAGGVRLFGFTGKQMIPPDDARLTPLWECARSLSIPVVVFAMPNQLAHLGVALRRYSDLPVALDHCGFPNSGDGSPFDRAQELLDLAAAPNLYLKITSRILEPMEQERAGRNPQHWVELLAKHFGPERLMWGSDFPATHERDYRAYADFGRACVSGLSESERDQVLAGTALSLWPALRTQSTLESSSTSETTE
jgi:predicted TIM-barrel fold metal-dependent hydrolase